MRTAMVATLSCLFASQVYVEGFRNDFGLTNPGLTLTIDEVVLSVDTQVREQYAAFRVTCLDGRRA